MQLSEHFTLEEFTHSDYAGRKHIDNTPVKEVINRLKIVAGSMEEVRSLLDNYPITVTSGYRCPAVNKGVGGSKTSAHMSGWAVDFICPKFGSPLTICKEIVASGMKFDQIIQEGTWVHLSFDPKMRQQIMTKAGSGYKSGL